MIEPNYADVIWFCPKCEVNNGAPKPFDPDQVMTCILCGTKARLNFIKGIDVYKAEEVQT